GSGDEYANNIRVDASGNAYIAGDTTSTNFPTLNAYQPVKAASTDAFVAKLNPTGSLVFSTYLGGNGADPSRDAATDSSGNLWVTGETSSTDFPTVNPMQGSASVARDGYLAKLSASGTTLLFSTYIAGNGDDVPNGMAVDSNGNVYLSGVTSSTNFPT